MSLKLAKLDGMLDIESTYFDGMVNQIYLSERQLNTTEKQMHPIPMPHFWIYFWLLISHGFVSSKIYNKRDDFDLDIINFQCIDGDIPRVSSCGAYISQLIRFVVVTI